MNEKDDLLKSTRAENIGEGAAIALNAIPLIGGVMSGIATSIIEKRQNSRLEDFLTGLATELNNLQNQINNDFVKTEEFADLAEDVFSKASETRQKEKLDSLKNIFVTTILSKVPNYDEATEVASLIDSWQVRHIILLRILYDPQEANQEMNHILSQNHNSMTSIEGMLSKLLPSWESSEIQRTWKDLYNAQIHQTENIRVMVMSKGTYQLEGRLSEFGKKVAKYIKSN